MFNGKIFWRMNCIAKWYKIGTRLETIILCTNVNLQHFLITSYTVFLNFAHLSYLIILFSIFTGRMQSLFKCHFMISPESSPLGVLSFEDPSTNISKAALSSTLFTVSPLAASISSMFLKGQKEAERVRQNLREKKKRIRRTTEKVWDHVCLTLKIYSYNVFCLWVMLIQSYIFTNIHNFNLTFWKYFKEAHIVFLTHY